MYENVATLLKNKGVTKDEYLNEIITYEERQVFVSPQSIYSSEFYQASQNGLHPSITFILANREDYKEEKLIRFNGKIYSIIRADWTGQKDALRLVCEERIGDEEDESESSS